MDFERTNDLIDRLLNNNLPNGFEWDFSTRDTCTMGLLVKLRKIENAHVTDIADYLDIGLIEAVSVFDPSYGDDIGVDYYIGLDLSDVSTLHVADALFKLRREYKRR